MAQKSVQSKAELILSKQSRLTADELRKLVTYDENTGIMRWTASHTARIAKGEEVGWTQNNGYRMCGINGKQYLVHRLAWLFVHGVWPDVLIDHIDRNRSNNALKNLRQANYSTNGANRAVKGVYRHKQNRNWVASVFKWEDGKRKKAHLGCFPTEEDATMAHVFNQGWEDVFGEKASVKEVCYR